MADPGLPTSITAGVTTGHVANSVTAHTLLNKLDTTIAATNTHTLVGDGTRFQSRALLSTDLPTVERNYQTGTAYTAVASDAGKVIEQENAAANTVTFGTMSAGTVIGICQMGTGTTTIVASGITINSRGGLLALAGRYAEATIRYRSTTQAVLSGDLA